MAEIRQKGRELRKEKGEKGRIENRRALPSKITESKVELANKNRIFDFVVIDIFWGRKRSIFVQWEHSQRGFNVHLKNKAQQNKELATFQMLAKATSHAKFPPFGGHCNIANETLGPPLPS